MGCNETCGKHQAHVWQGVAGHSTWRLQPFQCLSHPENTSSISHHLLYLLSCTTVSSLALCSCQDHQGPHQSPGHSGPLGAG
jgi:hypothetical protein